jgi:ribosomal protein S18 acetylase RimI-like enzyme
MAEQVRVLVLSEPAGMMTFSDSVLDNPVWHALTGPHAFLAEGDDRARCYPSETSWGAAVRTQDAAAYDSLARLLTPGRPVGVFGSPPPPGTPFRILQEYPTVRMVCEHPMPAPPDQMPAIIPLTAADVPAMLRLVALTEPGPLLPRSIDLGPFLSIQEEGQSVAMVGVRLHVPGGREISTVCTHPAYRRRGYASLLVRTMAHRIQQAGEVPFLHVAADHHDVIAWYESLGFVRHAHLFIFGVERI